MPKINTIDLHFLDTESAIAAFLVESDLGPVLIETGPETTWDALVKGIKNLGYQAEDIKHVVLTHIHFDHAGAAWKFAKNGAKIYVHPAGLPHLVSPERLWNSAKMIYKDDMERLWGNMEPIDESLLHPIEDKDVVKIGNLEIKVWYTPGHAVHHNSYQIGTEIITGDVAGVKIDNGPVVPPCPPPDINIELWKQSIEKLRALNPTKLHLTHFSEVENPKKLLDDLEIMLDDWANWIKPHYEKGTSAEDITPLFMEYTKNNFKSNGLSDAAIQQYEYANPSWMSVAGLLRYWKLKSEGRL